jgi:7-cyano-7-deazaguanine reductase
LRLRAEFWVRGGIYTTVVAEHRKPGWKGSTDVFASVETPQD